MDVIIVVMLGIVFLVANNFRDPIVQSSLPSYSEVVEFEDGTWAYCTGYLNLAHEPGCDAACYSDKYQTEEEAINARNKFLIEQDEKNKSETIKSYS